jgi:heptosyltransferase-2
MWKLSEIKQIKHMKAGAALLFNNSIRDPFLLRFAMVPKIFGAAARGRSFLMTRAYSFPKRISGDLNSQHHASKYLAMAQAIGAPAWTGELPEFVVNKDPEIIDRLLLQLSRQKHIMTLAAGAAYGEAKRWPTEYFKEVSRWWINQGGSILVVGTASEHEIGQRIIEKLPDDKAYNLAGKTDLRELIMLLQKSEVCVANDSGIMHLSAALNRPGIAIFGSTDPSATCPISAQWKVIYEKQSCSPCFKRECPYKTYTCMKVITPDIVISELKKMKFPST